MPGSPTVAVLDGSAAFRRGLRAMLEDAGFLVTEHHGDPGPASAGVDAAVVTLESGGDVARIAEFCAVAPEVPVVALAQHLDADTAVHALRAGSATILSWSSEPEVIVAAVQAVLQGLAMLPADVVSDLAARARPNSAAVLSVREAEWLQFLATGKTVAKLAEGVGYSEREMFRILADLYHRLGASNRSEALVKAARLGMLDA